MHALFLILGPIFLLVALGAALQRRHFLKDATVGDLNRLCYWVALPALVIGSLTRGGAGAGAGWAAREGPLLLSLIGVTILNAALGWIFAPAAGAAGEARGTFAQAVFRGNLAYVGVPILVKVPGADASSVMLLLAPMMVLYNALGVTLLVACRHGIKFSTLRPVATEWLRNPVLWASAFGGLAHARGWTLPEPLGETVRTIGQMTVPLSLLTVGAVLARLPFGGMGKTVWAAVAGKVALGPLLGLAAATLVGLGAQDRLTLLVALACPTAVVSFTMARELGGDEAMAARAVVGSTVASGAVLAVILAFHVL